MPGRTFEESQKIREQITKALAAGMETPSQVEDWITQRLEKGEEAPSLATISRIMQKEMGYRKPKWEKGK